jgi:hypothetical protein
MIDEGIKDEVESTEEIEIDLSENEGDTPEEQKDTTAPVTEVDSTEEEEKESAELESEESIETESESEIEEDDTEDSKKVFGKRAEKRIKRLVAQKKELEEKLRAAEQDKAGWLSQAQELDAKNRSNELSAINNYIDKLSSQEKQALSALKIAKENGNIDDEIKAQDELASVKAETLVAQQYKVTAESQIEKPKEQSSNNSKEKPKSTNPINPYAPTPDRKAVEWQKRNRWFGGNDTSDRIMTQAALVIHKELTDDGIIPSNDSNEYYNELDARIRTEFPERFKQKNVNKVPTVVGGSRANPGSSKIKLSKTEVEMANRLGVDLKEYARQKQRQLKAGG